MKSVKSLVCVIIFLVFGASAYAFDDGDFQVWNTDVEEKKIGEHSKVALEEEFRWEDNASVFSYQHYDIGYAYSLKKWLSVGGGYRHVLERKPQKFKVENMPYLLLLLSAELNAFKFESRSRFEYRHFDYQTDRWRYRNKMTLRAPWEFTFLKIQPFLTDEVFFSSLGPSMDQNRFYSGLSVIPFKKLKCELYYLLQSVKSSGKWKRADVFGSKLKVDF